MSHHLLLAGRSHGCNQSCLVPKAEIADNGYDLSINRYKEIVYEEVEYDPPEQILGELRTLEREITTGLDELDAMLAADK